MNLSESTPATIREIWAACAPAVARCQYLEDAATVLVRELYERFEESIVLVRAFLTMPHDDLPQLQRASVAQLAQVAGATDENTRSRPALCLLSTWGEDPAWQDRRQSKGHIAIPLVSEAFVGSIPMLSRLLKELGLPLTWAYDAGPALIRQTLGSEVGSFFVADATTAVDEQARKIISAQDFVAKYGVGSVIGSGGAYFGGAVLVLIMFSRHTVEAKTARVMMPLLNLFKSATSPTFSPSRVFHEPAAGAGA